MMKIFRSHCKKCNKLLGLFENDYCFECEKAMKQNDYIDAYIKIKVPKWQIGQDVSVYFKDTMCVKGICEEVK